MRDDSFDLSRLGEETGLDGVPASRGFACDEDGGEIWDETEGEGGCKIGGGGGEEPRVEICCVLEDIQAGALGDEAVIGRDGNGVVFEGEI